MVAYLITDILPVPMDLELCGPGEGEVTAARRLLKRVLKDYPRFFDVVSADALYLEAPFARLCSAHGKYILVSMKNEDRLLYRDAEGVFALMEPQRWTCGPDHAVRAWDAEGFTSLEGLEKPVRVVHTEETLTRRTPQGRKDRTEVHDWWWATTIPQALMPTPLLRNAGHRRWDVENRLFHALVTHWHMDHCFKHDPVAILNFVLVLFIAYVLMETFFQRNLKPPVRKRLTLTALARELLQGLMDPHWKAPWVSVLPLPDS